MPRAKSILLNISTNNWIALNCTAKLLATGRHWSKGNAQSGVRAPRSAVCGLIKGNFIILVSSLFSPSFWGEEKKTNIPIHVVSRVVTSKEVGAGLNWTQLSKNSGRVDSCGAPGGLHPAELQSSTSPIGIGGWRTASWGAAAVRTASAAVRESVENCIVIKWLMLLD